MSSHSDRALRDTAGTAGSEAAILDAAERLLHRVPLHDLTVAQIIEVADVSRATFYFYFDSKFGVLTGLVARVADELALLTEPFPDDGGPLDEAELRVRVDAAVAVWSANRPVLRAAAEHWASVPELSAMWLAVMERFTEAVAAEIERARAVGLADEGADSRQVGASLAWAIERGLYIAGLEILDDLPDERLIADTITRMWWGAVYGGQPSPPAPMLVEGSRGQATQ